MFNCRINSVQAFCLALMAVPAGTAWAQTETIIYTTNGGSEGTAVLSGLLPGKAGHYFAVAQQAGTNDNGTAFRINSPVSGSTAYTDTLLWTFDGTDANGPKSNLISDPSGNLYGTAFQGGTSFNGVVFELSPPPRGKKAWTESTIFDPFNTGLLGNGPVGILARDTAGNIYGATENGGPANDGVAFELTPPAAGQTAWTPTPIWKFTGGADGSHPVSGLVRNKVTGVLYGTTYQGGTGTCACGVVFSLTPPATPGGAWTQTTLHTFSGTDGSYPQAYPTLAVRGAIFGTTSSGGASGNGTVFKLTPPPKGKTTWGFTSVWSFSGGDGSGPYASVIVDSAGDLFGTTYLGGSAGLGAAYSLTPPAGGTGPWTVKVLHSFIGAGVDGYQPFGALVADKAGTLFGTTRSGGVSGGDSTIYTLTGTGYVVK